MKKKKIRIFINLYCNICNQNFFKKKLGLSKYLTTKNKSKISKKLKLIKHCKFCNKHTIHIEK